MSCSETLWIWCEAVPLTLLTITDQQEYMNRPPFYAEIKTQMVSDNFLFSKPLKWKPMKVIPSPQLIRDSLSGSLSRLLFNTLILNSEHGEHFTCSPLNSSNKIINLHSTHTRVNYNHQVTATAKQFFFIDMRKHKTIKPAKDSREAVTAYDIFIWSYMASLRKEA